VTTAAAPQNVSGEVGLECKGMIVAKSETGVAMESRKNGRSDATDGYIIIIR